MGNFNSTPNETVICSLCYYDPVNKKTQTIIESCKHKLCESCYNDYNYKGIICPLCKIEN